MAASTSALYRMLSTSMQLFHEVEPELVSSCLQDTERLDLKAGDLLLSPDKENDKVYLVLSGSLQVHLDSLSNAPLTKLPQGSCAGEMSIIEDKDPSAYVVAAEDTHLVVISHETLWTLVNTSHAFARNLLVVLSSRVRFDNKIIVDNVGALKQFERNAITDALTNLKNRHWMEDMFRRKIKRCQTDTDPACLGIVDVDYFKRFNDRYGHLAGDEALCFVADSLRGQFRPTDMIARYGGDEFVVLLPDTKIEQALQCGERVRKAVEEGDPLGDQGPPFKVTISMGFSEMQPGDVLETLLQRADSALYKAKLSGRNQIAG
ncbi:MAG: GGDEF domain-containing protein [Proteobacteria bacterium]|nr:GGDEF domain-containing protein [Pseudomonadota bacterium]